MKRAIKRQRTIVGRLQSEVDRKASAVRSAVREAIAQTLNKAARINAQCGQLKADHRMNRCHLEGETGDQLHAVLCAAGYYIRWLLRMIVSKGVNLLRSVLSCLQQASLWGRSWLVFAMGRAPASEMAALLERRASHNLDRLPVYAGVVA